MFASGLLGPLTLLAGILLFGGGLVLLARLVRSWRGGDQVLLVFLAGVVSVLGLATGWLGILVSTDRLSPAITDSQPTAPASPTNTVSLPTARPSLPPPRVSAIPTLITATPRPTPSLPPTTEASSPTASTSPFVVFLAQARSYEEQAANASNPEDQIAYLRQAEAVARALLASNPCEYTLQTLFVRICRRLSLLDPSANPCGNAATCSSG